MFLSVSVLCIMGWHNFFFLVTDKFFLFIDDIFIVTGLKFFFSFFFFLPFFSKGVPEVPACQGVVLGYCRVF